MGAIQTQSHGGHSVWKDKVIPCGILPQQGRTYSSEHPPWKAFPVTGGSSMAMARNDPTVGSSLKLRHKKLDKKLQMCFTGPPDVLQSATSSGQASPGCWRARIAVCTKIGGITPSNKKPWGIQRLKWCTVRLCLKVVLISGAQHPNASPCSSTFNFPMGGVSYLYLHPWCNCTPWSCCSWGSRAGFNVCFILVSQNTSSEVAPVKPVTSQQIYFTSSQASERGLGEFRDMQLQTDVYDQLYLLSRSSEESLTMCPSCIKHPCPSAQTPKSVSELSHLNRVPPKAIPSNSLVCSLAVNEELCHAGKGGCFPPGPMGGSWKDLPAVISSVSFHQDKLNSA